MDKQQLSNLLHIQNASRENRLVVFVGAGVSRNSGIPTWNDLIKTMKSELPDKLANDMDALKVAQLYKDTIRLTFCMKKEQQSKYNQNVSFHFVDFHI